MPVESIMPAPEHRIRDWIILALAMAFPTAMGWLYFIVLPAQADAAGNLLPIVFGAAKVVQFAFPLLVVVWMERQLPRFAQPTTRGLPAGVAFGLATGLAIFVLYGAVKHATLFEGTDRKIYDWLFKLHCATPARYAVLAAFYSLVHSLLEEYYWRWFVFARLARRIPWGWAAVVSGLAFMSHHVVLLLHYVPDVPGSFWLAVLPMSLAVGVGGMVWAWLYQRSQSLYAPWASHCLVDLAIMIVGYDLLQQLFQAT